MESLVLNGSGKMSGGTFENVVINGAGTVENDLECARFECNGAGKVKGSVTAKEAIVHGSTTIDGNLHSKNVVVNGHSSIHGDLISKELECNGALTVENSIRSENIHIKGLAKVGKDIEGETVKVDGSIQLQGLLNAEKITIKLEGNSFAKEVGGESVTVKRRKRLSLFDRFRLAFSKSFQVELIEADHVYLEYTKATTVRGKSVTLGPGCEIDLVEYQKDFTPHKNSNVKEQRLVD